MNTLISSEKKELLNLLYKQLETLKEDVDLDSLTIESVEADLYLTCGVGIKDEKKTIYGNELGKSTLSMVYATNIKAISPSDPMHHILMGCCVAESYWSNLSFVTDVVNSDLSDKELLDGFKRGLKLRHVAQ